MGRSPGWPQGGTHLLLDDVWGAATDGQQRCVEQRLADRQAAQQRVALQGRDRSVSVLSSPPNPPLTITHTHTPTGFTVRGRGCVHLQDVGETVLELLPAQCLAVHKHLPQQGPLAPQPPGHGIQQRGFPRAWEVTREGLGGSPP